MLTPRLRAVASRLSCPECRGVAVSPRPGGSALSCPGCGTSYPVRDGVPVLLSRASSDALGRELSSSTGTAMVEEYRVAEGADRTGRSLRRRYGFLRPPEVIYHTNPYMRGDSTRKLFELDGAEALVLNVGGGPTRYSSGEIAMNLRAFLNVDLVGDAHNVPFLDDTFDSVICNAVLEHVHDAEKVVSEMIRVLKPGGYLYAEVPYIFFFHGYPNDFRRYTREGMKRLFAELDELRIGIVLGPVSALLQSANIVLQMFVPTRIPYLRKIVNGAFRLATFWLKYLDLLLVGREEAHILAGAFYALGRKPPAATERAARARAGD